MSGDDAALLVIDVGTTGLRAAVVASDGGLSRVEYRPFAPSTPFPGLVEFDAVAMGKAVLSAATAALAAAGDRPISGVGITNQRASTIVWDRATGTPIAPALGWQDLRTVGECITARAEHGLHLAPNQSATKIGWLLSNAGAGRDPAGLCFGTVDSWVAWVLSGGSVHVTDRSNAAVTGLYSLSAGDWDVDACAALAIPTEMLPTLVDTAGVCGSASALPGAPPIAALVGDQQASLAGQGCVTPGHAKLTFGTGGMLDVCTGQQAPIDGRRSVNGTFPIVAWTIAGKVTWGVEAIMLSAGSNVDWLCDDLGLIATPAQSATVAAECDDTGGVVYIPALLGLGTPNWDYGARGTLLGLTRGSGRAHVVRAVLEGIAQRGADLVAAAQADTGLTIPTLRVDGGMSRNPVFVQALADATGTPVEVSPVVEATTLGAGLLAGVATGVWNDLVEAAGRARPSHVVRPGAALDRAAWAEAVGRAGGWIPELSTLDF